MSAHQVEAEIAALDEGRAFVDRSSFRKLAVGGSDAGGWLNDLVTAGVGDLAPAEARRSLLLTPTGRIRADFQVVRRPEGYLLLQEPEQPSSVEDLLAPYVLSSDVELRDASAALRVFCLPGRRDVPGGLWAARPSMLGDGTDVVEAAQRGDEVRSLLESRLMPVSGEAVEGWRIRRGVARFPVDMNEDSLPSEAGLEALVDFTKGCFLGQESVAKVRNLGHPPRIVVVLRAPAAVAVGDRVTANGREVGLVTSVDAAHGGTVVLARVRWESRAEPLATSSGVPLERARPT